MDFYLANTTGVTQKIATIMLVTEENIDSKKIKDTFSEPLIIAASTLISQPKLNVLKEKYAVIVFLSALTIDVAEFDQLYIRVQHKEVTGPSVGDISIMAHEDDYPTLPYRILNEVIIEHLKGETGKLEIKKMEIESKDSLLANQLQNAKEVLESLRDKI